MNTTVADCSRASLRSRTSHFAAGILTMLILTGLSTPASAASQTYFEDFTTTTYKDPVNTTADWNTAAEFFFNTTWAKRCDADGDLHLGQKAAIAFLTMIRDGDILCRFDPDTGWLQWWEADQPTNLAPKVFAAEV